MVVVAEQSIDVQGGCLRWLVTADESIPGTLGCPVADPIKHVENKPCTIEYVDFVLI